MNAEDSIKLRIVVELLRRNLKALNLEITAEEWEHIAFAVFRNGYGTKKNNDSDLWNGVRNLLPNMLKRFVTLALNIFIWLTAHAGGHKIPIKLIYHSESFI